MTRRYGVYFCPQEDTELYRFGSWWLGRDCRSSEAGPPPDCELDRATWQRITEAPGSYGLHATLKPPFALADGVTRDALVEALADLAARHIAFEAPSLQLVQHQGFLALKPSAVSSALTALADACVTELDRFRRPAAEAEIARRRAAGLTPRQDALLLRWGYPYVLDQFGFHITLTERLTDEEARLVQPILASRIAKFQAATLPVVDLCLFEQAGSQAPFILTERLSLAASPKNSR
jgi:putative phosphonate metabolism protein